MAPYSENLIALFAEHANPSAAPAMAAYMKNHFDFFGIKAPIRAELLKMYRTAVGKEVATMDLALIVNELWAQPQRECQYAAMEILYAERKHFKGDMLPLLEKMVVEKSWWDTVDTIASNLIGYYFQKNPAAIKPVTDRWMASENMWLQRCCLIFQLKYRDKTDFALLQSFILPLLESKEFFIQKAIGWALRQHARTDTEGVVNFVENTPLKPLSRREALKHQ